MHWRIVKKGADAGNVSVISNVRLMLLIIKGGEVLAFLEQYRDVLVEDRDPSLRKKC